MIEAPPGAGKTTRVPPALLHLVRGNVLVLEPRRLAVRLAARRVAQEMSEALGETVGYQVRFEEVAGPRTRLRFLTEGILTRRLISDPLLSGVDAVVLDEFHERHLETDLALALLRRLQRTRPDLLLVVMSATLDAAPVARFLGDCPIVRSEGRLFDLTITYQPYSAAPLEQQVAAALETLPGGDVLVFLPGAAEIRKAARECQRTGHAATIFSSCPYMAIFRPPNKIAPFPGTPPQSDPFNQRRRKFHHSRRRHGGHRQRPCANSQRFALDRFADARSYSRISKASATQRAGRAARTAPGRVIRLYTLDDFHRRRDQDPPEILRRELSELCLTLRAIGISNPSDLEWLDAPPELAVSRAEDLLSRLGATGDCARRMARFPLHPRLARMLIDDPGVEVCRAAAVLSSGARSPNCDLMSLVDSPFDPATQRHFEQIRRIARPSKHSSHALGLSVLHAFPDRVARRRKDNQLLLAPGVRQFWLAKPASSFWWRWILKTAASMLFRWFVLFCAIEPDWLIDKMTERSGVEWNRTSERVDAVSALMYETLVIEETRSGSPDPEQAAALLAERALDAGIERFVDREELDQFLARMAFASEHTSIPKLEISDAFRELCRSLKSFAELKTAGASLLSTLEQRAGSKLLNEIAPRRIRLPSGRQTKVNYETGKPPWIASRLQDFFGMRETPRIANGKVAVVVHLLAPNQRPVQTTTDLAGFWQRLYPQVRRELSRRYPKHKWPENPS